MLGVALLTSRGRRRPFLAPIIFTGDFQSSQRSLFVSFLSVHQPDVTLKALSPLSRLMLAPFPPIFGTSEGQELGSCDPQLNTLIIPILTNSLTTLNFLNRLA
jgi:hypothetical protein